MYQKIRRKFRGYSIRKKIGMVYGLGILPFLLVLSISVLILLNYAINRNIDLLLNNNSQVIINQLEDRTKSAESCANIMLGYLNELSFLRKESTQHMTHLQKENAIMRRMTYAYLVFNDIDSMVFIDNEENVYADNVKLKEECMKHYPRKMLEHMNKQGGQPIWFDMLPENNLLGYDEAMSLTMGKNIIDIDTGERLGVLFVSIAESSISQIYKELRISPNSYYVIANQEYDIVSSPETTELGSKALGSYLFSKDFTELPYILMFQAPIGELMEDSIHIIVYILIIGICCITIALIMAMKLGRRITVPITILSDAMHKVSAGDLSVRCFIDTADETKMIGDGFNEMLDTMEQLIINVRNEQRVKRKYELALIQSQIKPHFLYNTLDTIYALAHMNRTAEAKQTAKALADFYRVSLSAGREIISIGAEIKCIEDYLKIQEIRYADDFTYHIDIDEALYGYSILKLSIQPLVENAIYHGLRELGRCGFLQVYAEETEGELWICVKDDGIGMPPEVLHSLLKKETTSSFGIKNLNDRIHLYFGEHYGLETTSVKGEGTLIKIHIPKIKGDREND